MSSRTYSISARSSVPNPSSRTYRVQASVVPLAVHTKTFKVSANGPVGGLLTKTYKLSATTPETPIASAGQDRVNLYPWKYTGLSGSSTSNDVVSRKWRQISGVRVDLINPDTDTPHYFMRGTNSKETLVFGYSVAGSNGVWSVEDEVSHTFRPSSDFAVRSGSLVPVGVVKVSSNPKIQ